MVHRTGRRKTAPVVTEEKKKRGDGTCPLLAAEMRFHRAMERSGAAGTAAQTEKPKYTEEREKKRNGKTREHTEASTASSSRRTV